MSDRAKESIIPNYVGVKSFRLASSVLILAANIPLNSVGKSWPPRLGYSSKSSTPLNFEISELSKARCSLSIPERGPTLSSHVKYLHIFLNILA